MSLCASCGDPLPRKEMFCPRHIVFVYDWAVVNRIMYDFLHRKESPQRLAQSDRDDGFGAHTGGAA